MPEATSAIASRPQLVRAIGRWSLVALTVNCVIGSGVFGLPSELARLIGGASVLAVVLAAAVVGVVMACFAEVSSQFTETGGPYLYVRAAFGRLMGIEVGWLIWVVRIASCAANANLFVIYLAEFWPPSTIAVRAWERRSATPLPWPNFCRSCWCAQPEPSTCWRLATRSPCSLFLPVRRTGRGPSCCSSLPTAVSRLP